MMVKQITPPEFHELSDATLRSLSTCKSDFPTWEKPYRRKDGSLTWVRLTASVQRDGAGEPLHLLTFVEDINAQKTAEVALASTTRALKTSETRFRTVFQTILDSVAVSRTEDSVFIEVNEAFLQMTGFDRDEVIGKSSDQVNIWADVSDRRKMTEALHRNSSVRDIEIRFRKGTAPYFGGWCLRPWLILMECLASSL